MCKEEANITFASVKQIKIQTQVGMNKLKLATSRLIVVTVDYFSSVLIKNTIFVCDEAA